MSNNDEIQALKFPIIRSTIKREGKMMSVNKAIFDGFDDISFQRLF